MSYFKVFALREEKVFSLRETGVTGLNFKTKKAKGLDDFIKVIQERLDEIEKGNIKGDIIFFVVPEYVYPISKVVKGRITAGRIPEGTRVLVGIQKVSPEVSFEALDSKEEVEHTGESVSARFADPTLGTKAALNAHSETFDPDAIVKETDFIAAHRIFHSLRHFPLSVVAVGETSLQRQAGSDTYINEVQMQLVNRLMLLLVSRRNAFLDVLRIPEKQRAFFIAESERILRGLESGEIELVIAYEPIWSIGERAVGKATPKEAKEMLVPMFRTLVELFGLDIALKIRFQYGGSLDAEKAGSFAEIEDTAELTDGKVRVFYHGGLVGGAAYKAGANKISEAFNR